MANYLYGEDGQILYGEDGQPLRPEDYVPLSNTDNGASLNFVFMDFATEFISRDFAITY